MKKTKRLIREIKYTLPRLTLHVVREDWPAVEFRKIERPLDAAKLLSPLSFAAEEYFISLHLNAKHEVIGLHEVSHGTLSASLVHPREVYKAALLTNSFAILVCHNHPSGSSLSPSAEDILTTKQLLEAGRVLGVSLIDHIIIGTGHNLDDVYSLREKHSFLWEVDNKEKHIKQELESSWISAN